MWTIIAVCSLLAGATFTPPDKWSVSRVEMPEEYDNITLTPYPYAGPTTRASTKIYLTRTLGDGETATFPEKCELQSAQPEGLAHPSKQSILTWSEGNVLKVEYR